MRPAAKATTPTSAPGSSLQADLRPARQRRTVAPPLRAGAGGFTLIELMIVIALIAVSAGIISLALRDPAGTRLETEAQRLGALLESARAESRASGLTVIWLPSTIDDVAQFRFARVLGTRVEPLEMPTRWLDPQVRAEVVGARAVQLGPEPLIGAQRIVLQLADQRVVLATDGLAPFAVASDGVRP